jgi:hypothetical protein
LAPDIHGKVKTLANLKKCWVIMPKLWMNLQFPREFETTQKFRLSTFLFFSPFRNNCLLLFSRQVMPGHWNIHV